MRASDRSRPDLFDEKDKYKLHPTTLVHFRQRLLEAGKSELALRAVLEALEKEGFVAKRSKQRLDSTHILGAVARLSALECVRETIALALEELDGNLPESQRPQFWEQLWERYVESKLDYKSAEETLQSKRRQAGADCLRLLDWLEPLGTAWFTCSSLGCVRPPCACACKSMNNIVNRSKFTNRRDPSNLFITHFL